jgi:hypothetical protein
MAVHKATRSKPLAQPQPQHGDPRPERRRTDPQLKAEIFETLRHLNRGYGVALAALERLEKKDRLHTAGRISGPRIFPEGVLDGYQDRTEALRAEANRDLLHLISAHEDHEALRFTRLHVGKATAPRRSRRQ